MTAIHSPKTVLRNYFRAKDENRPHLMNRVFCENATLQMNVQTANITFPALSQGLDCITDVLVSSFAKIYENVYSFCLAPPPERAASYSCRWLVGMTEKDSGGLRVGCGRYDWDFEHHPPGLAQHLTITIEAMESLPPHQIAEVYEWLGKLSYPWTSSGAVLAAAPHIEALSPVLTALRPLARQSGRD